MEGGASRPGGLEGAAFSLLERGIHQLHLPASDSQIQTLAELAELLSFWAEKINLTGHRAPTEIAAHLILDAAALCTCLPEIATAETLTDLGTGAGFPGLPIAILNPHLTVELVDARQKRNHFQRHARRTLDLRGVHPRLGRVEELAVSPSDIVIAQAMAQPEKALQLMAPWSKEGGILVLPASEEATAPSAPPGWDLPEDRSYVVPVTGNQRRLWVLRRLS